MPMAEDQDHQNRDWNRSGELQANQVRRERGTVHPNAEPPSPPADEAHAEGRDRAPSTSPRDEKSPWLGGG